MTKKRADREGAVKAFVSRIIAIAPTSGGADFPYDFATEVQRLIAAEEERERERRAQSRHTPTSRGPRDGRS